MTNLQEKTITINTEKVLSVGGLYYNEITIPDKDYKAGDVVEATITSYKGGSKKTENQKVEIMDWMLNAIKDEKEDAAFEEELNKLKAGRSQIDLWHLEEIEKFQYTSLINQRCIETSLKEFIECEDDHLAEYSEEERENLGEHKKEQLMRKYIASLSEKAILEMLDCSFMDYGEVGSFSDIVNYESVEKAKEEGSKNAELLEKLYEEQPDEWLLMTTEMENKYENENGLLKVDNFHYRLVDTLD